MAYAPTKYNDVDLALKADRFMGAKKDPAVLCFQQEYIDLGGPPVKTAGGRLLPLVADGDFGTQTQNALLVFQEACGLQRTGALDQLTMFQADWRVYGEINGSWKHAKARVDRMNEGGPAIKAVGGWAFNGLVQSVMVPVDDQGCSREQRHLSDVLEAKNHRSLGFEGSVLRLQRGTSRNSTHGEARAGDDSGDQNKDRRVDAIEMLLMKNNWDYLYMRTVGPFSPVAGSYTSKSLATGKLVTVQTHRMGRDGLTSQVLGNLKYPDGTLMFPGYRLKKDVAQTWAPNRGTHANGTPVKPGDIKQLDATVHTAPFHHHTDCAFMWAPYGSPF